LLLVVGNGVAKLPDQILPLLFSHPRLQPINDPDVFGLRFFVSDRCLGHELCDSFHVLTKLLGFLLVLISATGIAAGFGPFAHSSIHGS
jgi:hypothetical protein